MRNFVMYLNVVKEFQAPFVSFSFSPSLFESHTPALPRGNSFYTFYYFSRCIAPFRSVNLAGGFRIKSRWRKKKEALDLAVAYYAAKTFLISTPPLENVKCITTYV